MTKNLLLCGGLLVGGAVLAAVTAQHDVGPRAGDDARPVAAAHVVSQDRWGSPTGSSETLPPSEPAGAAADAHPGAAGDVASSGELAMATTSDDTVAAPGRRAGVVARLLGLARREQSDADRSGEIPTPPALLGDPVASDTGPAVSAPAGSQCKSQDLQAQPQGVSADVTFVGVLLGGSEREDQQFSGAELSDLKILVQWANLFSHHRQRVELIAPDGSVYQSLSRLLTTADSAAPVTVIVPVSGSWITRYGLYGAWCVDVFFDQDDKPVASRRVSISS